MIRIGKNSGLNIKYGTGVIIMGKPTQKESSDVQIIKERAIEVLSQYEKTRSAIRKEIRREYTRQLKQFEKERLKREKIVKEKMNFIEHLESRIESLNNTIFGLRSRSKLWEHECARISDAYHRTIMHYANPGLVEVQLQVISEYTDALIRFVGIHKWDDDTVHMVKDYCQSLSSKIDQVIHVINANKQDDISLVAAQKNITNQDNNN